MYKAVFLLATLFASHGIAPSALAGTLTNLSFVSNGGSFVNDTIDGNASSPLAFTVSGATTNAFLNNPDSSISLGFGSYYAIAFLGFGQHLGSGSISFLLDGTTTFSQNVTFPANSPAGVIFASFSLPGGDLVQISTTGLSADRISIIANGGGLAPDQGADAFYQFSYTAGSAVPEPATIGFALAGLVAIVLRSKQTK